MCFCLSQSCSDIIPKVFNALNTNTHTNESRNDSCFVAHFFRNEHVAGVEWALYLTLYPSKAGCFENYLEIPHETQSRFVAALDDESHHAGSVWNDALSNLVIWA